MTCSSIISSSSNNQDAVAEVSAKSDSPVKFDQRISDIRAKLDSIKNKIADTNSEYDENDGISNHDLV